MRIVERPPRAADVIAGFLILLVTAALAVSAMADGCSLDTGGAP